MNEIKTKRLAIFLPGLYAGGAQRALLKLANGIAARGYSIDLVLAELKGPFLDEVSEQVRIVNLNSPRTLLSLPELIRYLRREQPYAMLSALNYVNIVALVAIKLAKVRTRLIVSQRNTLSHSYQGTMTSRGRGYFMNFLIRHCYFWSDGIVAVSAGVADDLAVVTGIPRKQIDVIYNPIVTPEVKCMAQAQLDHPWFAPGEPPVLLAVGSLTPQKDFTTLIQAFAMVRKEQCARLLILGEGKERALLEKLIQQLNLSKDVNLPGFVKNPYAYMTRASGFVLSSRWEGLPGVLIEALYCGTPLVATDCPSGPREILADGKYGTLVSPGDIVALAEALKEMLKKHQAPPQPESWKPFEQEMIVDQYLQVLLG